MGKKIETKKAGDNLLLKHPAKFTNGGFDKKFTNKE